MSEIIKAGTKVLITCHTGFCGSDSHEFYELQDDITEDQLNMTCWEMACENASHYGIYSPPEFESDEDEDEDEDSYSDNIEGHFEIYDAEKHDGYRCGYGEIHFNKL